jgi:hypothetical protein
VGFGIFQARLNGERGQMPRKSESPKEVVDVIGCIALDNEKRYRNDRRIDKTAICEKIVDAVLN